jgi:hypothetical protein
MARFGVPAESPDLANSMVELSALLACAVAISVPWAFRPPYAVRAAGGATALSVAGGLLVLGAESSAIDRALRVPGWVFAALGILGVWSLVLGAAQADSRNERRRVAWVVLLLAGAAGVVAVSWQLWPGTAGYYVTCAVLGVGALLFPGLWVRSGFRPMDEHLLDVGLGLAVVVTAGVTAALVRLGSELANQPSSVATGAA